MAQPPSRAAAGQRQLEAPPPRAAESSVSSQLLDLRERDLADLREVVLQFLPRCARRHAGYPELGAVRGGVVEAYRQFRPLEQAAVQHVNRHLRVLRQVEP